MILPTPEKRRLAYLAVTRPKNFLMLSYADKRQDDDKLYSRFLDEMPSVDDGISIEAKTRKQSKVAKTPEVLPTTLVFSPNREMLATLVGPQTKESLLSIIEEN